MRAARERVMLRSPAQQGAAAGGAAAGGTPSAVGAGGTRAAAAAAGPALNLPLPQRATSSALALLFSEVVQRARDAAATGDELEARLADAGADVGTRAMELVAARQRPGRREIRLLGALGKRARSRAQRANLRARVTCGSPCPICARVCPRCPALARACRIAPHWARSDFRTWPSARSLCAGRGVAHALRARGRRAREGRQRSG